MKFHRSVGVLYWLAVIALLGWTILRLHSSDVGMDQIGDLRPIAFFVAAMVVLWVVGIVVVCVCIGLRTTRSVIDDPLSWFGSFHGLGEESAGVLADLAGSRVFQLGWWASWVGTTLASAVPAFVAIMRLGSAGLGVVGLALLSIGVNLSWRLPIELRLHRLRDAAHVLGDAPVVATD